MRNGTLAIARSNRSNGTQSIQLEIRDSKTSNHILIADVSLSDFSKAITGLNVVCLFELFDKEGKIVIERKGRDA